MYLRLSRDDGSQSVSESIENQKNFLTNYAREHNFNVVDIISDDGFTGTNFNRPGFCELIKQIEENKINTVITKEMSRLGRDYIQTGYYIEQYFPTHNVRYIAVNDGIDTSQNLTSNDIAPFKAVFNDMYAKDISNKVRTALTTKKINGKFIGAFAPYGYKKDANDKNHLVIDTNTSPNVKRIFRDFLDGKGFSEIARGLTADCIPTPSQCKGNKSTPSCSWNATIIKRILSNPTYAGHLTQNMTQKINYKVNKRLYNHKNNWITVENTHDAIISNTDFNAVQRKLYRGQ